MSVASPSLPQGNSPGAISALELTVTGEDAGNNLFREKVTVVNLQGRECTYESRLRMQPGASLMVEIPSARKGEQTWRAAAIVETVSAADQNQDLFQVNILLGRAYEPATLPATAPAPRPAPLNPTLDKSEPKRAEIMPPGAPVSESQMRDLKIALANKKAGGAQSFQTPGPPQRVDPARTINPTPSSFKEIESHDAEPTTSQPMVALMVREAMASESERLMHELSEALSQEMRASQASMAQLTQYAKSLPVINEQIIRQTIEEANGQHLVRTTALLKPAIAEMVREAVVTESERRTRELKDTLLREVENAIHEPLAVMAQYTQTLPAIDEKTMSRMVGEAAEQHLARATASLQSLIAEALRDAVAAERERQTQQLKRAVFIEVGKAIEGPVALQMAAMLDSALRTRLGQPPQLHPPQSPPVRPPDESETVSELMRQVQAMLDSAGGNVRCVLEPKMAGSDATEGATAAVPALPVSPDGL